MLRWLQTNKQKVNCLKQYQRKKRGKQSLRIMDEEFSLGLDID